LRRDFSTGSPAPPPGPNGCFDGQLPDNRRASIFGEKGWENRVILKADGRFEPRKKDRRRGAGEQFSCD
jgi:hypothetical protein